MAENRVEESQEGFREVVRNLFTIEVSTIVSEGMTARKMPPVPIALLDIVGKYYWFLKKLEHTSAGRAAAEALAGLDMERRTNASASFTALRQIAGAYLSAYHGPDSGLTSQQHGILQRIYRQSMVLEKAVERMAAANPKRDVFGKGRAELMGLYSTCTAVTVPPEDLAYVRKAWETGTDEVVMQSTMQVDGDVITRLHQDYLSRDAEFLQQTHMRATQLAVETWSTTARFVSDLVRGAFSALLKFF